MRLDTTAAITTPERVRFHQRIAGPGRRALAWMVDASIQLMALILVGMVATLLSALGVEGVGLGGVLVVVFFLQWWYGAFFESILGGRTPGKLALRLRVVTVEGAPATVRQYILRHLLTGADFLPLCFGVGVVVMASDARLRRLGDFLAGTVVVDESPSALGEGVVVDPPITEAERRAITGRVELSTGEIRAIEALLRAAPRVGPERARELAQSFAAVVAADLGIPATEDPVRLLTLAYARATGRDRALDGS